MVTYNLLITLMFTHLVSCSFIYPKFNSFNEDKSGQKRLQGVGVRGRLMCGKKPLNSTKVKIVDVDTRPDLDDLLGETLTDEKGLFQVAGATRELENIDVIVKIYHECLDEHRCNKEKTENTVLMIEQMCNDETLSELKACQRKVVWKVPSLYYNNGTLTEWFDVGSVNMEIVFPHEERDCRH